jgi:outer membrane protein TolC
VNLLARGGGEFGGDGTGLQGVGLFASWELDLWGRVRAVTRAAETQYESARLDAGYARQSLSALVTKGWVLAIEARLQKACAAEMEQAAEGLAALAHDRLRVGVGDDYEVALAQAN